MATFKALSNGTRLVLVGGPLLLFSLFFTWQNILVDYGPAGVASAPRDGFDAWGLLLALLVIGLTTIVALRNLTEVEMSEDVPWDTLTLGLGLAVLAVAGIKNLTDAGSTWASYGFVALAALVAFGTYLDRRSVRGERTPSPAHRRRGISSVV
jgi:hypothetical protein